MNGSDRDRGSSGTVGPKYGLTWALSRIRGNESWVTNRSSPSRRIIASSGQNGTWRYGGEPQALCECLKTDEAHQGGKGGRVISTILLATLLTLSLTELLPTNTKGCYRPVRAPQDRLGQPGVVISSTIPLATLLTLSLTELPLTNT